MQRMTRQRTAIMEFLGKTKGFLSAQQIHDELRGKGEKIGLATVYRTVQVLADNGELDVVRTTEGESLYRACADMHHHHHLVCRRCQHTEGIFAGEAETWIDKAATAHGFTDVEHTIELFGLCAQCSE